MPCENIKFLGYVVYVCLQVWQKQEGLTEGYVVLNTFGWKRQEMVILMKNAQEVPLANHKSILTQTLQNKPQIGLGPSIL